MAKDSPSDTTKYAKWTIGEQFMKLVLKKTEDFYHQIEKQAYFQAVITLKSLCNLTAHYLEGQKENIEEKFTSISTAIKTMEQYNSTGKFDEQKQERDKIIDNLYEICKCVNMTFSLNGAYLITENKVDPVHTSMQMN